MDDDDMDGMDEPPCKRRAREDSTDNVQFLHPSDVIGNMAMDGPIDESETFGRLVIAKLKKLNDGDAADAQIEILQVLKKYLKPSTITKERSPSPPSEDKSYNSDQILS